MYTFSFLVGNIIPKRLKCIHSATKDFGFKAYRAEVKFREKSGPVTSSISAQNSDFSVWKIDVIRVPGLDTFRFGLRLSRILEF